MAKTKIGNITLLKLYSQCKRRSGECDDCPFQNNEKICSIAASLARGYGEELHEEVELGEELIL